jgi:hypothetical protein
MKPSSRGERGSAMAEAAITLPVVILVCFAMINMALAGFASINAANAANYGARVGSVHQTGAAGAAISAARQASSVMQVGTYNVSASGSGAPGSQITVKVDWKVPNFFSGIMAFLGGGNVEFKGTAQSSFRREGW